MDSAMQPSSDEKTSARSSGRRSKSASAFRTISEVADELDVAQHVLRFWESKFPQVRPLKRGGGRRYYRPEDVDLLRRIRSLLYEEGYTIKGAQKLLKGQRRPSAGHGAKNGAVDRKSVSQATDDQDDDLETTALEAAEHSDRMTLEPAVRAPLVKMRNELKELRDLLKKIPR